MAGFEKLSRRMAAIFIAVVLCAVVLVVRIGALGEDSEIVQAAQGQSQKKIEIAQCRGTIYDRDMQPLVNAETGYKLVVTDDFDQVDDILPSIKKDDRSYAREMAKKEQIFAVELTGPVQFSGGYTVPYKKRYGSRFLCPHLIGYLQDGQGFTGLEAGYEDFLRQAGGTQSITFGIDALGQPLRSGEPLAQQVPDLEDGVVLTIDKRVQQIIEEEGKSGVPSGSIVVLDCATGQVRGAASFPSYDPQDVGASLKEVNSPLLNKTLQPYSVGSTFKLVSATSALEAGLPLSTRFTCTGSVKIGDTEYKCHRAEGHGEIDMAQAIELSCNCYFVQLAEKLDPAFARATAQSFGFGQSWQLAPGLLCQAGNLPSTQALASYDLPNFSFGQGGLTATPLQLAAMVNTFARGGEYLRPTLVQGIWQNGSLQEQETPDPIRVMEPQTAQKIADAMVAVTVTGTGRQAAVDGVRIAGKTATAQTGEFGEDGIEKLHSYFSGFFPAEDPRYTVLVFYEYGGEGSFTAAPVFAKICARLMELE